MVGYFVRFELGHGAVDPFNGFAKKLLVAGGSLVELSDSADQSLDKCFREFCVGQLLLSSCETAVYRHLS